VSNRHAQARAFGLCRKEWLENPGSLVSSHAWSLIGNANSHSRAPVDGCFRTSNSNLSTLSRDMDGIFQYVSPDLPNRESVDLAAKIDFVVLAKPDVLSGMQVGQVRPCLAPRIAHVGRFSLEIDRRGVLTNLLVEHRHMVL
jgi:hypothetical protein